MANRAVALYKHVKIRNRWTFQIAPEPLERLKKGAYYVSWYEGKAKRMQRVGPDPRKAEAALEKKRLELAFVAAGGRVQRESDDARKATVTASARKKVSVAIDAYLDRCRARQGKSGYGMAPRTIETYRYHLGFLLQFAPDACVDEADNDFLYAFLAFLPTRRTSATGPAIT
jgi:hypothetical protein